MKRVKNIWTKAVLFVALCLAFPFGMKAQDVSDSFFHIDWQFNVPLNNKFAGVASGWGMNFEGGYYFTEHFLPAATFYSLYFSLFYPLVTVPSHRSQ